MSASSSALPLRQVHAVCSHDCPDSCAVQVSLDHNGRAVKIAGDPAHPVTQGFLCGKVARYFERVDAPDRLYYPLRRKAGVPKGPQAPGADREAFERVSWDEALDGIAAKLKQIAAQWGPESILPYSYAGTTGVLGYGSMDRRFFNRLGACQLDRTICAEAGGVAWNLVYGKKLGTPIEEFHRARLIVVWGCNVHGNNVHLWPQIEKARRSGARLIVIDPYPTRTAQLADWHIALRPGTDGALALALAHVLFREGLVDREFLAAMTIGAAELEEHVKECTPAWAATWTGLEPAEIEELAREYAAAKPSVIRLNYGVQRCENGGEAVRAIAMLPALVGAWRQRGGGAVLSTSGAFSWNKAAIERPDLAAASPLSRPGRMVNMSALGAALTKLDPPVKALFVYNSNPAAVAPNQNAVRRGLGREDLFTVVHDLFLTDTADYADYVLPATTFLEQTDIQGSYGHYYVQLSEQAVEPPGEARSNVWLFAQLAQRMGFTEACFNDTPEQMIAQALDLGPDGHSRNPGMEHITLAELRSKGHVPVTTHRDPEHAPWLPFASGTLTTPSGRIELCSETLKAAGRDPLPHFAPAEESRWGSRAQLYPLEFLPRKADHYMNSTFANVEGHREMQRRTRHALEINPADAEFRGIAEGDRVRVWNDRGEIVLRAVLNARLPLAVVAGEMDWAKLSPGGTNVNALTSERLTDHGGGATFYSTLVEVERA